MRAILIIIALTFAAGSAIAPDANLLWNGGFEFDVDSNGIPDEWSKAPDAGEATGCALSRTTTNVYADTYALNLTITDGNSTHFRCGAIYDQVAITGGLGYVSTAQGKIGDGWVDLHIFFYNALGQRVSQTSVSETNACLNAWCQLRATAIAPLNATTANVMVRGIYATSVDPAGWANFDAVRLLVDVPGMGPEE